MNTKTKFIVTASCFFLTIIISSVWANAAFGWTYNNGVDNRCPYGSYQQLLVGGEMIEQNEQNVGGVVFDSAHLFRFNQCSGRALGPFDQGGSTLVTERTPTPIGGLTRPAIPRWRNNYVYVLSGAGVERFNVRTGMRIDTFIEQHSGGLYDPKDMVFGPDGNLFITNNSTNGDDDDDDFSNGTMGGGQVLAFNGTTGAFLGVAVPNLAGEASGPNRLSDAMALAFGPDGTLYVGNDPRDLGYEECNVLKFKLKKNNVPMPPPAFATLQAYNAYTATFKGVAISAANNYIHDPNSMAFGKDGKLYIAWQDNRYSCMSGLERSSGHYAGAITSYNPKNGYIEEVVKGSEACALGFTEGSGIAFGPDKHLYVGSGDTSQIFDFDLTKKIYNYFPGMNETKGIIFIPTYSESGWWPL